MTFVVFKEGRLESSLAVAVSWCSFPRWPSALGGEPGSRAVQVFQADSPCADPGGFGAAVLRSPAQRERGAAGSRARGLRHSRSWAAASPVSKSNHYLPNKYLPPETAAFRENVPPFA